MGNVKWTVYGFFALLFSGSYSLVQEQLPEFLEPVNNVTAPAGRDATFTCVVDKLGDFKVAWIHMNRQMIIAIHSKVITRVPRFSVSYDHQRTWRMTIKSVEVEDRGGYMCQVNSDPLLSQVGYLTVVVPPEIADNVSSPSQVTVREGGKITLTCKAEGFPRPKVTWRREDSRPLSLGADRRKVLSYFEGPDLTLTKITRTDTGAFLCIAANGVPPTISKRTLLEVEFPPTIWVSQEIVGAPHGGSARLECQVEAWPKAIVYWVKGSERNVLLAGKKHSTKTDESGYISRITLGIQGISRRDFDTYKCMAKNALGEAEVAVKLHEIIIPTTPSSSFKTSKAAMSAFAKHEVAGVTQFSFYYTTRLSSSKIDAPRYTREKSKSSGNFYLL
ncbi:lachesin-like isoform X1 [Artemia franciscana]|uniref:lachesin-like isoform X1 n=1 Tax=Artemia franciscana TaxID=6661 RepID=UPI0032DAA7F4